MLSLIRGRAYSDIKIGQSINSDTMAEGDIRSLTIGIVTNICCILNTFIRQKAAVYSKGVREVGMCGKSKFGSDSVFKNRTVTEPSKNLTSVQTVFRQKLRANSQFMLKVTKS